MTHEKVKIPIWFWIVTGLFLVWNFMGVAAFFQHISLSEEAIQAMPAAEQELYGRYPIWTKVVFALAVLCGFLGCLGLM